MATFLNVEVLLMIFAQAALSAPHRARSVLTPSHPLKPRYDCLRISESLVLDHQALHLLLQRPDLSHKVTGLVGGDARCNHVATNTAAASQRHLARNVNVRHVLVFAKKREVENDCQRRSVCNCVSPYTSASRELGAAYLLR